jgi:hypothetical protein
MAFIVKRDAVVIPAGIPVSSTNQISIAGYYVNTNTSFIKKNTFNQFLGNPVFGGDVAYMGNGTAYIVGYYDSGGDRFGIQYVLLAPNSTIMDNPSPAGNWMGPFSNWRLLEFYSDDGTQTTIISENPSTNANYIPTTNWSPSLSISSTSVLGLPRQIFVSNNGIPVGAANNGNGTYTIGGLYNGNGGDTVYYAFDTDGNAKIALGYNYIAADNNLPNGISWYVGYYYDNESAYSYNISTDANNVPIIGWTPSITITSA